MGKRTFKNFITWLLIASPLWWMSGCYTYKEVTRLDEVKGNGHDIKVTTKGNNAYIFMEWTSDTSRGIHGRARWKNPFYDHRNEGWSRFKEGYVSLPADSIKSVAGELYDGGLTALAVFLPMTAVAVLVVLISESLGNSQWR